MKRFLLFLLLLASGAALAQQDTLYQLAQLKQILRDVQDEEQSVYQSYQMLRALRLHEVQQSFPPMAQQPYGTDLNTPPPDYYDVLRLQQAREARIQQYTADLGRLTDRFFFLESERKSIVEDIAKLEQQLSAH